MKLLKRTTLLVIVLLCALLLVATSGCGSKPSSEGKTETEGSKVIKFLAAKPGGAWYPLATAIAEIWEKNIPGLKVSIAPGGGASNVVGIAEAQGDVGFSQPVMVIQALMGKEPYEKSYSGVEALAVLYPDYHHIAVWQDSKIQTVADLKGKKLNANTKGYTAEVLTRMVLQAYGLDYKDLAQVQHLGDADGVEAMKDGHVDAVADMGGIPDSSFIDLSAQRKIRLLPVDDEHFGVLKGMNAAIQRRVIPAGTYNGVDRDVPVIGTNLMIMVNKGLPEETVYQMAKYLAENLDKLYDVSKSMKQVKAEDLALDTGVPFHDGAAKYYKEKGWLK